MKKLIIMMAFVIGLIGQSNAQESFFKESLSGIKKVELTASTQITVVTGSTNDITLSWGSHCEGCKEQKNVDWDGHEHDKEDPYWKGRQEKQKDRAKGLQAIYANGVDNTGLGMAMERDGEILRIRDLKPITQRKAFTVTLPKNVNLHVDTSTLGSVRVENFTAELEINSNVGGVSLIDVTGPVTAHTSTGSIDVVFSNLNQNAPISLTTATGLIDVTLPANTKADVEMSSTMGTVYSNFDLVKPRTDGLKNYSGDRKIKGQLNNGGVKIILRSSTGNIYLRKK